MVLGGAKNSRRINKTTIILILISIIVFIVSCVVRKPYPSEDFYISDSPYHVLLTMESYKENPISVHRFLPIQTLGAQYNKFIDNGPSILHDDIGNAYYVTFSPMGFFVPYVFCRLLGLGLSLNSIYLYNCCLMLLCGFLCALMAHLLFKKKIYTFLAFIIYIFTPEVLYTQGIVYWHQSLSQVFFLMQLTIFSCFIADIKKLRRLLKVLFLIVSFLYAYTEWSGIISNIGFAICILIWKTSVHHEGKKYRLTYDSSASTYIMLLGGTTLFSLCYYFWRFSQRIPIHKVIEQLSLRAELHTRSTFLSLLKGYIESYGIILIFTIVLICLVFSIKYSRRFFIANFHKKYALLLLAALFPLTENMILREHALIYSFDRLKLAPLLIIVLIFSIKILSTKRKIWIPISMICIAIASVFSMFTYATGKTNDMGVDYHKSVVLRDFLQKEYLNPDKAILVKCGQRAWGYLQTFYHRNIFCTEYYSQEQLIREAKERHCQYIVYLPTEAVSNDTGIYKEAEVFDLNTGDIKRFSARGKSDVAEMQTIHCRPFTDKKWSNGVFNSNQKIILLENTPFNRSKIADAKYLVHEGKQFKIISHSVKTKNITLVLDKIAKDLGYPNELAVK